MMITFSIFFESAILRRLESNTLLFIVALGHASGKLAGRRLEVRFGSASTLYRKLPRFPVVDGLAQLEEGDDPERDRQPEGDQAEDENRREDRRLGDPEEDEGADHPGVDRPYTGRRQRKEIGDHAEEEALDHDRQRHMEAEGVEGSPEHADAGRPEA